MPATGCGCPPLDYRPCHMPRMTIQHAFSSATPVTGDRCSRDDFKMASQAAPWRRSLSSCEGSCCTATVEHPLRHRCAVAPARTHSPEHATLWRTTWPPPPPTPHLLHVLPVSAALILTTSSLLTRLCVSCSCRSTFGHHLLGVPDRILPRIGSPPIARGCASPRRPVYFPLRSLGRSPRRGGPESGFCHPPLPPQVPSSSPPWPRSTTTSIWRLSGCATPSRTPGSTFFVRAYPCRHLPSHGPFDALLPTLRVPPHR